MQLLTSALKPLEFCSIIVYGQTNVTTKSFTENYSRKIKKKTRVATRSVSIQM